MKTLNRTRLLIVFASMSLWAIFLIGCGSGGGGGSRGDLSEVVTNQDVKEEGRRPGESRRREEGRRRGEGPTRTRTDHLNQNEEETTRSTSHYGEETEYRDSDDVYTDVNNTISVISWIAGLFSGGGDESEWDDGARAETTDGTDESSGLGRFSVGYRYSWSNMAGDAVDGFESSMISVGVGPKDRFMASLGYYFGKGESHRADIEGSLTDLSEAGVELALRVYFTPDHTALGSYFLFGARLGEISWRYRDPPLVPSDGGGMAMIYEDYLLEGGPILGVGVSILQTRHLHLGANAMTGIRFTSGTTNEDFNNDVFKDVGFFQFGLEGHIQF